MTPLQAGRAWSSVTLTAGWPFRDGHSCSWKLAHQPDLTGQPWVRPHQSHLAPDVWKTSGKEQKAQVCEAGIHLALGAPGGSPSCVPLEGICWVAHAPSRHFISHTAGRHPRETALSRLNLTETPWQFKKSISSVHFFVTSPMSFRPQKLSNKN